jgi:hypothetical protein
LSSTDRAHYRDQGGSYITFMATVYFARWMLLDTGEVLENGALSVEGEYIASAGHRSQVKRKSDDRLVNLGDTLLLPGFINMHVHLEECVVRGGVKSADETFAAFIAKKNSRVRQTGQERIHAGIKLEIRELLAQGTTTLLDSSQLGYSNAVLENEPVRAWVVNEAHADDPAQDESAPERIRSRAEAGGKRTGQGIGPHALFSLYPLSQRRIIESAAKHRWLWASHLAESAEELQAFSERKGDLYFYITRKKTWPFGETAMGSMHLALTENLIPNNGICFHCNYAPPWYTASSIRKRSAISGFLSKLRSTGAYCSASVPKGLRLRATWVFWTNCSRSSACIPISARMKCSDGSRRTRPRHLKWATNWAVSRRANSRTSSR